MLRGDDQVSYSLHGGLCMGLGEVIEQRLTAPPHARCMDLIAMYGGRLVPFLLVHFFLGLLLKLYLGFEGLGGGWARRLSRWGV